MNHKIVSIRPINEADTDLIVKWRNNPRVRNNFLFREKFSSQMHKKWLEEVVGSGKAIQYIICIDEDSHPVGSVYFSNVEKTKAEYGIFIGEDDAVKRGVGTVAGSLLLEEGFRRFRFEEIYLRVFTDNISAIKSYEKVGFQIAETLKDVECSTGEKKDMFLMKITRGDYDKL